VQKRVFPTPPGPVIVTSLVPSSSNRRTSRISFVRPTSGFAGLGRFVRKRLLSGGKRSSPT